jgi:hypothetical protein
MEAARGLISTSPAPSSPGRWRQQPFFDAVVGQQAHPLTAHQLVRASAKCCHLLEQDNVCSIEPEFVGH